MQDLHLVGYTTDRRGLIFSTREGARSGSYVVPIGDELLTAIAELDEEFDDPAPAADPLEEIVDADGDRATQVPEQSRLSVRDVQARLRSGEPVEAVATAAGVSVGWVERFAPPVRAEQRRIVERALAAPMRRPRTGESKVPLRRAVALAMAEKGIAFTLAAFDQAWTSRLVGADRWVVEFTYHQRGRRRTVGWEFDAEHGALTTSDRTASQIGYVAPDDDVDPDAGQAVEGIVGDPGGVLVQVVDDVPPPSLVGDHPGSGSKAGSAPSASAAATTSAVKKQAAVTKKTRVADKGGGAKRKVGADRAAARSRAGAAKKKAAAEKAAAKKKVAAATKKAAADKAAAKKKADAAKVAAREKAAARRQADAAKKKVAAEKAAARKKAAAEKAAAKKKAAAEKSAARKKAAAEKKAAAAKAAASKKKAAAKAGAAKKKAAARTAAGATKKSTGTGTKAGTARRPSTKTATSRPASTTKKASGTKATSTATATTRTGRGADASRRAAEADAPAEETTTEIDDVAPAEAESVDGGGGTAGARPVDADADAADAADVDDVAQAATSADPAPSRSAGAGSDADDGAPTGVRRVRVRPRRADDAPTDAAARDEARRIRAVRRSETTVQFRSGSASPVRPAAPVSASDPDEDEAARDDADDDGSPNRGTDATGGDNGRAGGAPDARRRRQLRAR